MNHRKAGGDDVLKYLNSIESRHRVDAAWHALDDLFQGLCSVDPPGRDMF
jgi:hypothetical protein